MSTVDQVLNTGSQAFTNYDTSKIFIWENRFQTESYNNSTYDDVTLEAGTVMGRVASTGKIVPFQSNASNGSQYPIGVLNQKWIVEEGDTVSLSICVGGDVASDKLVFTRDGDGLTTSVGSEQVRDLIRKVGIKLVSVDELTGFDNQ